jgi:hypothetical protein
MRCAYACEGRRARELEGFEMSSSSRLIQQIIDDCMQLAMCLGLQLDEFEKHLIITI